MENGSSAKKMEREPIPWGSALAEVPLPPEVPTDSCTVCTVTPSMVCEFGENEQLEPDGPTQVKLMVLLKPFKGAMVMLKTAVLP